MRTTTPTPHQARRAFTRAAIAGVLAALLAATPALAHVVAQPPSNVYAYQVPPLCTWVRAEISHGPGGGYVMTTVKSRMDDTVEPCHRSYERPAGYLIMSWHVYKWTGSQWAECVYSWNYEQNHNWYWNTSTASSWSLTGAWFDAPCGTGTYAQSGGGYVLNGDWNGGFIWSGQHDLPTTPS
jgi:hypothetical protein